MSKKIIVQGDTAGADGSCDDNPHCSPIPTEFSLNVTIQGKKAHTVSQSRVCGHKTVAFGNNSVYINGKLAAVDEDPNSGGGGNLNSISQQTVFVG